MQTYTFKAKDGVEIAVYKWLPGRVEEARAVVQLVHGSLEYALRYEPFVRSLLSEHTIVYAHDIRGHGKTAEESGDWVYLSDQPNGWELAIDDIYTITCQIQADFPDLPIFIFGHSLGSLMVRDFISQYGQEVRGVLLVGTGRATPRLVLYSGLILAKLLMLAGRKRESPLAHRLICGELNKAMENPRTDYDFISRDPTVVQEYIDDPQCGLTITVELAHEMVRGFIRISNPEAFANTPQDLPILLLSGTADPMGAPEGRHVLDVAEAYRRAGVKDVLVKLYDGARHELLNELNKDEVIDDMVQWLNDHCPSQ